MSAAIEHPASTLVEGRASGKLKVLGEPLSFWGGLDSSSGKIIDRWHPQFGETISGHILLLPQGRGSSSGSSVLAEALRLGTGPAGIILMKCDPIIITGAAVATLLYALNCPVVHLASVLEPGPGDGDEVAIEARPEGALLKIIRRD
ncbi:MAG: DUF126 domain-containing protein [Rhizobiaceae bacterium]